MPHLSQPVIFRPVEPRDAPALLRIYNWAVQNTTATMDVENRSPETQAAWIDAHDGMPYPALVAEDAGGDAGVVAYASLSAFNPKPGYRQTDRKSVV